MNATIAWVAGGCLAFGWVAGFLAGSGEPGETAQGKTERLFREGLLEVGMDLAELEEATTAVDRPRAVESGRSRDRSPVGVGASSSVLT